MDDNQDQDGDVLDLCTVAPSRNTQRHQAQRLAQLRGDPPLLASTLHALTDDELDAMVRTLRRSSRFPTTP